MPAIPRKLTPERVAKLRALKPLIDAGLTSQRAVAAHFGLSQSTVSDILSGKKWAICPAVDWKPSLVLVDVDAAAKKMDRQGGRFASHQHGVVTLPGADARSFTAADDGDEDVVDADDEGAAAE